MQVVTYSQEELDVLVSDIAQRADISKNAAVGLFCVRAEGVDCNIAMPIATAKNKTKKSINSARSLTVHILQVAKLYCKWLYFCLTSDYASIHYAPIGW